MFDELFNTTSYQMGEFSSSVRDQFGQSIVLDVFKPLLNNISSLRQMEELFKTRVAEIDRLIEELQSIGGLSHGQ